MVCNVDGHMAATHCAAWRAGPLIVLTKSVSIFSANAFPMRLNCKSAVLASNLRKWRGIKNQKKYLQHSTFALSGALGLDVALPQCG